MSDWHFNFGEDGYVGVIDVERHNGESRAYIGDPKQAYGDIARFREFAEHYEQLQAAEGKLKELRGVLEAEVERYRTEERANQQSVETLHTPKWVDEHRKLAAAAAKEAERLEAALLDQPPQEETPRAWCPCHEPIGGPPCTAEKPCPYGEGMPAEAWGNPNK